MSNSLDTDQHRQNVGPDRGPICLLLGYRYKERLKIFFSEVLEPKADLQRINCVLEVITFHIELFACWVIFMLLKKMLLSEY